MHPRSLRSLLTLVALVGGVPFLASCGDTTLPSRDGGEVRAPQFYIADDGSGGGGGSVACSSTAGSVEWQFWRDEDAFFTWTTASNITVGQRMRVRITARDTQGCVISNSEYGAISSSNTTALTTEYISNTDARLVARQYTPTVDLVVYVRGQRFSKQMFMSRPRLELTPNAVNVAVGGSANITLRGYDHLNRTIRMEGWRGSWTSDAATIARVEEASIGGDVITARVTGVASGSTYGRVLLFGERAAVSVTVSAAAVASVEIQGSGTLTKGEQRTYTAVARDASGNVVSGLSTAWSIDNTSIATVTQSGTVTAVAAGSTVLRATAGGTTGQLTLTITAPAQPPSSCLDCKTPWVPADEPWMQ